MRNFFAFSHAFLSSHMNGSKGVRDRSVSFSDQVCRFFVQDKCLKGDLCSFSHDLTQSSPEEPSTSAHVPSPVESSDSCCSICLQHIYIEGKRFGLLPRCNHLFCLDCILSWRAKSAQCASTRPLAKQCPVCRIPSYFVIPSVRHYAGDLKTKRAIEYLNFLSQKPCRYFSDSANICPYGEYCFFFHHSQVSSDNTTKLRLVFADGGPVYPN